MELIKHLFGACGEHHPNIFSIIFGSSMVGTYFYFILFKLGLLKNGKRDDCKE